MSTETVNPNELAVRLEQDQRIALVRGTDVLLVVQDADALRQLAGKLWMA